MKALRGLGLFLLFLLSGVLPLPVEAGPVKGMYGVPPVSRLSPSTYFSKLKAAHINAVFVPPDGDTIRWFKQAGLKVYVSVNAFGGKGAWKPYPDSRPVTADGKPLGLRPDYQGPGGVCPTHQGWRQDRLTHVETLVREFQGDRGIDGVWLDFIRYPGLWEVKEPRIPDTCYCPRCLRKFQKETGVTLPHGVETEGVCAWIRKRCPVKWMQWKKEQILSFVMEVRERLHRVSDPMTLGLFLVPWSKGERQNAISYQLAQDAFALSNHVDVISPMVYHKMCGKESSWVGYMTRYYKETARCQVWPIVEAHSAPQLNTLEGDPVQRGRESLGHSGKGTGQGESGETNVGDFGEVPTYAAQGGADGLLVYSFKGMTPALWGSLKGFQKPRNLMANPGFKKAEEKGSPPDWHWSGYSAPHIREGAGLVRPSREIDTDGWAPLSRHKSICLGIHGGDDRAGTWSSPLPECEPGQTYLFTCWMYRHRWQNGVYPVISLWGKPFVVDTLSRIRRFQPVRITVTCPGGPYEQAFRFINRHPGFTFWMTKPCLTPRVDFHHGPGPMQNPGFFRTGPFPIGIYGGGLGDFEAVKGLGINTVVIGGRGENLRKRVEVCQALGLRCVIAIPRDPDRLPPVLDEISSYARPQDLAFYVNDEPGFYAFPMNTAEDINRLVKEKFPDAATCMAVVRPQVCRDYENSADFFMLDQYPVPNMPMIWLSDSMDEARKGIDDLTQRRKGAKNRDGWICETDGIVRGEQSGGEKDGWMDGEGKEKVNRYEEKLHTNEKNDSKRITNRQITDNAGKRMASVIQAFGGDKWARMGWPRAPTWQEMDCLAFLSVVHGSRGIFFFTYSVIGKTEEGRQRLKNVVGRLNQINDWLEVENLDGGVHVDMVSRYGMGPDGRSAVHACLKRKGDETLLIAVNTVGTFVEAEVSAERKAQSAESMAHSAERKAHGEEGVEVFSGQWYGVMDGKIRARFGPYETKAFLLRRAQRAERRAQSAWRREHGEWRMAIEIADEVFDVAKVFDKKWVWGFSLPALRFALCAKREGKRGEGWRNSGFRI